MAVLLYISGVFYPTLMGAVKTLVGMFKDRMVQ
jgi:hypothetical protein